VKALCPSCREALAAAARVAIEVLSDQQASEAERRVAANVACGALKSLQLPAGEVADGPHHERARSPQVGVKSDWVRRRRRLRSR